jgi:hypothetical protein
MSPRAGRLRSDGSAQRAAAPTGCLWGSFCVRVVTQSALMETDELERGVWVCGDCPDRVACATGYPCSMVKAASLDEVASLRT